MSAAAIPWTYLPCFQFPDTKPMRRSQEQEIVSVGSTSESVNWGISAQA